MATATKHENFKLVTKLVEEPVNEYRLILNDQEADTLAVVMARVGGHPDFTPRTHIDSISRALQKATGRTYASAREDKLSKGGITFSSYGNVEAGSSW